MELPAYLLPRPGFELSKFKKAAFEEVWKCTPHGAEVNYSLPHPKWQFLTYLCERWELVLHGSPHVEIGIVEPRHAVDKRQFSSQKAIYATTDGIWVIYFAIIDRLRYPQVSLFNSCLSIRLADGSLSEPGYFFSISHNILQQHPWCPGMVYILPRQSFEQEPPQSYQGQEISFPHWISQSPVEPCARLHVEAADFPFLNQVHGHNNDILVRLLNENPGGFPWPEALIS